MAKKSVPAYNNESIQALKGADRVRKRPAVIFGSDGIDGCKQTVFEILSNSLDESRQGFGDRIIVTHFNDDSVEIEDFGRGMPVDFNNIENEYNWKLLFCELYAGGKYNNLTGENYEYSLGTNGLGLCATQYSSEYMQADIRHGGFLYNLRFIKGEPAGEMEKTPYSGKQTGTRIKWRPDLEVFTEIQIDPAFFEDVLERQAVVNAGVRLIYRRENGDGFLEKEYYYSQGLTEYVAKNAGEETLCSVQYWEGERAGRDREDKPEYSVRMSVAFCFSNHAQKLEYYHNSSFLEYGGAPERAVKNAFVAQTDALLKDRGLYKKGESKINFTD
ncbi:MAG: ATP-binding protein, partial [Oscillospiraceae bacterium]|nr:ATP-binding protein [Oscillospiraceae bacterium]